MEPNTVPSGSESTKGASPNAAMEELPDNPIQNSSLELNPELVLGLDDEQINLFKIMNLFDHIRTQLLHPAKPLLYAWHQAKQEQIDEMKEEYQPLAKALNKATNLLETRSIRLKTSLIENQALNRLDNCTNSICKYLELNEPYNYRAFAQKNSDHPAAELNAAYYSTQTVIIRFRHSNK